MATSTDTFTEPASTFASAAVGIGHATPKEPFPERSWQRAFFMVFADGRKTPGKEPLLAGNKNLIYCNKIHCFYAFLFNCNLQIAFEL